MRSFGRIGLAVCVLALGPAPAWPQTNFAKECGIQYLQAKANNELNGRRWPEYLKDCRARIGRAETPETPKPHPVTTVVQAPPKKRPPPQPAVTIAPAPVVVSAPPVTATMQQSALVKRVALVIGNGAYKSVPALPNPPRDAEAMAALFRAAGFDDVKVETNLSGTAMRRALRVFADKAADADAAVVFYAGHGVEIGGRNYLVPVDAALATDLDVKDEAIELDRVLELLEPVKRLKLVILDACRENPFANRMRLTTASRSVGRGLAPPVEQTSNTLVAYAARAGAVAADGDARNSPFTAALLNNLTRPGLDVRIALGKAHDEVLQTTSRKQEPFVYGALGGDTLALAPGR